ncbi:MAG TPA: MarR family transcriptional regulator [Anaerolineae bacterium]|nr:MarR family transcriptional regulator [Anaerolineae bacterium]
MRLPDDLLPEEVDVMQRVSGLPVDFHVIAILANIWRAAQAFRLRMERTVLREFELTWASFSTLFIVWIWGPIETREIAKSQNVTRATVTNIISLLEERGLCLRRQSTADRRLVLVELTPAGEALIKQVFPLFNRGEAAIAASLTREEQETLARLLRKVVNAAKKDLSTL